MSDKTDPNTVRQLDAEIAATIAMDHLNRYLQEVEGALGKDMDDVSGLDACIGMCAAIASLLVRQLGEKSAVFAFATFVQQMAEGVPGMRMDVVRCDKLPTTPQEAMAMSLDANGDERHD